MSALSDALNAANTERWSTREIARRAGDRVSHTQLGKYLKPNHPQPSDAVLLAFSEVFGIPLPELRDLAGRPAGENEPYMPPPEANLLNARQRRAVDEMIRSMVTTDTGLPGYLAGVLESLTPAETRLFLVDLHGSVRKRLDYLWEQRKRWVDRGGLPIWDPSTPDTEAHREAHAGYEDWVRQEQGPGPEPDFANVWEARRRRRSAEGDDTMLEGEILSDEPIDQPERPRRR